MESSVSVLFPVHNAQATLQSDIGRVLEVLPELSSRFDILIIDDGSTDATEDIAHELTLCYPQVHLLRQAQRKGLAESIHSGFQRTQGDVILVHDAQGGVEADELPRLWNRRHDPANVSGGENSARTSEQSNRWFVGWLPLRKKTGLSTPRRRSGGFHLLQRKALRQMQKIGATNRPAILSETQQPSEIKTSPRIDGGAGRIDTVTSAGATRRPSFLRKLREFAIGE